MVLSDILQVCAGAVSTPQLVSSLDPSNSTNNPQWQSLHVSHQAHTMVSHE
ncbi:uncharacterized protein CCOS01_08552 [Colletotrichum costaricense]|uniref:Uncharacterized protein n=1 Tax=Colletotrichum costaricense TaxID=1209916 RepID=A0AAJ0E0H2_9PEZI|nr:uncharacterized protein CCOS01_08552 [Colletotrichum costaricense]KAK1526134.1 hypothetical protein CCOS01_08552 [Colletotrichum costaricense]